MRRLIFSVLVLLSLQSSAQNFITRQGKKLFLSSEEIHLRGIAFGNRVWVNDPLPDQHHGEIDYQRVHNMGMNAIRFYLNYLTLEDDAKPYQYKQAGWDWLDQNIAWAKKYDVYLILNIHVPQGGFQSQCKGDALWTDSLNQIRVARLWKAIAKRYVNEPQIAGFDLVNEPIPLTSVAQWEKLAQRIIDSVRTVDQNHLMIAANAIALNCDYGYNDGKYNYPILKEDNLMYTVHLYDPYEYTTQLQAWANTGEGGKYPDEKKLSVPGDIAFGIGQYSNPSLSIGTSDWTYYKGNPFLVNADSLILGRVSFYGHKLGAGKAYYDDITLNEVDAQGNMLKEIFKVNLQDDTYWYWSEKNDGSKGIITNGHNDNFALTCTGASGYASITAGNLSFKAEKGKRYMISGWMKGENIPSGATAAITTEFYYSPSHQSVMARDKNYLRSRILDYAKFPMDEGYPVYFGEFGVVRDCFDNDKGGAAWVKDAMDIFDSLDFHFTYHVYREDGFGLYKGWDGVLDSTTVNQPLKDTFTNFFKGGSSNIFENIEEQTTSYPNPFSDSFSIAFPGNFEYEINDVNGAVVEKGDGENLLSSGKNLSAGIYFVRVKSKDGVEVMKVVKQ
ncbi:MAG: cellulase family glycosylhydrolase [Flavobacteriales bacterium]